jgi:cyclic pyranopterin phosphate synthase
MEAMVACSVSLLTVYDMIKAVQKDAVVSDIKLVYKFGGKSDYITKPDPNESQK